MTITVNRGSAKKPGPIDLGSKIIRFKLPHLTRRFTVHEDLICATSLLFHTRLQKHRKALSPTDDCPVCVSPLDGTTDDITFCVKCGQNVHETCIEAWKRQQGKRGLELGVGVSVATCPMCRAPWKNEPLLKYLSVEGRGEAGSVQGYLEWLYSGRGDMDIQTQDGGGTATLALLQSWEVADTLQDDVFRRAIIRCLLQHTVQLDKDAVIWAFSQHRGSDTLRAFLLELAMCDIAPGWFAREASNFPDVFVRALADAAMGTYHVRLSRQGLGRKHGVEDVHGVGKEAGERETAATVMVAPADSDDGHEVRVVSKSKPNIVLRGPYVTTEVDHNRRAIANRDWPILKTGAGREGDGSVGGRRVRSRFS